MRFTLLIFTALGFSLLAQAQPPQSIELPPFKGIDVQTHADVYLSYGATQSVRIEGSTETIQHLSRRVNSKGTWNINSPANSRQPLRIYVTLPSIQRIILSGTGSITCTNQFNLHHLMPLQPLEVELSGQGAISLNVDCRKAVVHLSGDGNLELTGAAGVLNATLSGNGELHSATLASGSAKLVLSGSGTMEVTARDWLNATLSGSGEIAYKGNPPFNVTKVTGDGAIVQRH